MLTLNEYQGQAAETAVYPGAGGCEGLTYSVAGLTSEAGEVAGEFKRIIRDDGGELTPERRAKMASELGDALWGLAMVARDLGLTLEEVAVANVEKLRDRKKRGVLSGSGGDR